MDDVAKKFDDIEAEVGIQTFMSPDLHGFTGVLKARFTDFIVHEVNEDGVVARLTSQHLIDGNNQPVDDKADSAEQKDAAPSTTDGEADENAQRKRKRDDADAKTGGDGDDIPWADLTTELAKMVQDESIAKSAIDLLEKHTTTSKQAASSEDTPQRPGEKFVTLPLIQDKQVRKQIHTWVRERLSTTARADTKDRHIRIWHVAFEKEMPNYKTYGTSRNRNDRGNDGGGRRNAKNKKTWPEDRPNYLQFVLYKENMDTTTATKEISRSAGKARIGFAGMKDKRGITTQFCTLYRTEPQVLMAINRNNSAAAGGSAKYRGKSVVQIGNFQYTNKEMRLGTLQGNRFAIVLRNIKLDGSGSDAAAADATSATKKEQVEKIIHPAADSLKKRGFINYFGTQRFGRYYDTHLVGLAALSGNFRKAVDIIMQPKPDENRQDIYRLRCKWRDRFDNDPAEMESTEKDCAREIVNRLNRFMTGEISILQSLSRFPKNYKRAFSVIPKTLRMMYYHAIQSLVWNQAASYRIEKLGATGGVVKGDLVKMQDGTIHVIGDDDISKFALDDVVLPLIGTKSQFPHNASGEKMKELLEKDLGVTVDMFGKADDRNMRMSGDYRKLICRPKDVEYKVMEYHDPIEQLVETDWMQFQGQTLEDVKKSSDNRKDKKAGKGADASSEQPEQQQVLIAVAVEFTLPSSSYATIALRELMKRPTSSEFQKNLKLEG